jgi:hypothetical protein
MQVHILGCALPTKVKNLLFHPSQTLLVLGSLSTVAECTLHIDGGNIGGTRRFQREHATVTTVIQQDAIGTKPTMRINQKQVLLQKRLQNLCNDRISGRKTVAQFLHGVAFNIRLSRHVSMYQCLPIWTTPFKLMNLVLYIRQ